MAYSGGTGTLTDPFLLSTPDDWMNIGNSEMNGLSNPEATEGPAFMLTNDIDFEGVSYSAPRLYAPEGPRWSIDGAGFSLKNIVIGSYSLLEYMAFLDMKNLTLENLTGSTSTVYGLSSKIDNCRLENVHIVGFNMSTTTTSFKGAGFAEYLRSSEIVNCTVRDMKVNLPVIKGSTSYYLVGLAYYADEEYMSGKPTRITDTHVDNIFDDSGLEPSDVCVGDYYGFIRNIKSGAELENCSISRVRIKTPFGSGARVMGFSENIGGLSVLRDCRVRDLVINAGQIANYNIISGFCSSVRNAKLFGCKSTGLHISVDGLTLRYFFGFVDYADSSSEVKFSAVENAVLSIPYASYDGLDVDQNRPEVYPFGRTLYPGVEHVSSTGKIDDLSNEYIESFYPNMSGAEDGVKGIPGSVVNWTAPGLGWSDYITSLDKESDIPPEKMSPEALEKVLDFDNLWEWDKETGAPVPKDPGPEVPEEIFKLLGVNL